jgi:hypothetical protein
MAQHRAFQIPEIVQEIIESIEGDSGFYESKTLLSVTLTCKLLSHVALDRLWWEMKDLTPLMLHLSGTKTVGNERLPILSCRISKDYSSTILYWKSSRKLIELASSTTTARSYSWHLSHAWLEYILTTGYSS